MLLPATKTKFVNFFSSGFEEKSCILLVPHKTHSPIHNKGNNNNTMNKAKLFQEEHKCNCLFTHYNFTLQSSWQLWQSSKESESITRCELCFKNLDQNTHKTIAILKLPKDKFCSKGAERKCSKLVGLTEQKTRRKLLLHNTRNCKCLTRITNVHYLLLAILNYKIPPKVQPTSHENL